MLQSCNEDMWTELFLNQQPLVQEIDEIIKHLTEYRESIAAGDAERLRALLRDGRMIKRAHWISQGFPHRPPVWER